MFRSFEQARWDLPSKERGQHPNHRFYPPPCRAWVTRGKQTHCFVLSRPEFLYYILLKMSALLSLILRCLIMVLRVLETNVYHLDIWKLFYGRGRDHVLAEGNPSSHQALHKGLWTFPILYRQNSLGDKIKFPLTKVEPMCIWVCSSSTMVCRTELRQHCGHVVRHTEWGSMKGFISHVTYW